MGTCQRTVIPFLVKRKVKTKVFALSHDKSLGSVFMPHIPPFYLFFLQHFQAFAAGSCWRQDTGLQKCWPNPARLFFHRARASCSLSHKGT